MTSLSQQNRTDGWKRTATDGTPGWANGIWHSSRRPQNGQRSRDALSVLLETCAHAWGRGRETGARHSREVR